jgi:hypothetical protein
LAKFAFSTPAHVVPGHSTGLVCQRQAGTTLDFGGPSGFDIGRMFCCSVVKAGQ